MNKDDQAYWFAEWNREWFETVIAAIAPCMMCVEHVALLPAEQRQRLFNCHQRAEANLRTIREQSSFAGVHLATCCSIDHMHVSGKSIPRGAQMKFTLETPLGKISATGINFERAHRRAAEMAVRLQ